MAASIPNVIHFVFGLDEHFGNKPFCMAHYIAIRSAYDVNHPDAIFFHCAYEPHSYWWDLAKPYVTVKKLVAPTEIFGNRLSSYAHMSDIVRLRILLSEGGIYLDIDTICLKPFAPLLSYPCVLGYQTAPDGSVEGLCNAVILAQAGSRFLREWYDSYTSFRGNTYSEPYWDEHSVQMPLSISTRPELQDSIHIEPADSFFVPHWTKLADLFERTVDYSSAFCLHLWESQSYDQYLAPMTADGLRHESTYNQIARQYLPFDELPPRKQRKAI